MSYHRFHFDLTQRRPVSPWSANACVVFGLGLALLAASLVIGVTFYDALAAIASQVGR